MQGWRRRLAVLLVALAAHAAPAAAGEPKIGQPAPDFRVTLLDGSRVSLSDLKGQVVVVNFWAVWCGPCRQELPLLEGYYRLQRAHGLTVVAILGDENVAIGRFKATVKALGLALPIGWHYHGGFPTPDAFPTSYVVDRAGVLRFKEVGAFDLDTLNDELVPLLQEPPPQPPSPATHAEAASAPKS